MSLSSSQEWEVASLLHAAREGMATPAELQRLNEVLFEDAGARQLYFDHVLLGVALRWSLRGEGSAHAPSAVAECPAGQVVRGQSPVANAEVPGPPSPSPVLGFLGRTSTLLNRPIVWSIFTVAVVFYGTFVLFSWNLHPDKSFDGFDSYDLAVARINDATDVHWSQEMAPRNDNAPVHPGERLAIDTGFVQLELKSGATLTVEGPAHWSIDGENSATLQAGKLIANVPQQAIGFTLDTPTARVVDLGTEFGVEVSESGATDLQVSKGSVELVPGRQTSSTPVRVSAGDARRVEVGTGGEPTIRTIVHEPQRFTRAAKSVGSHRLPVGGAMASSDHTPNRNVNHLVDGSGLQGDRHTNVAEDTMWHTAFGRVKDEFVLFDLGRLCRLDSMKVWNFNENIHCNDGHITHLFAERGVAQADIYTSKTGKGDPVSKPDEWNLVVADRKFAAADGTADYSTPEVIPLGGVEVRFVAIVIDDRWHHEKEISTPENQCVGLSEVQFFGERVDHATARPKSP